MKPESPSAEPAPSSPPEPRGVRPLDDAGWRWAPGRGAPDGPVADTPVLLPHSWNAVEEYRPGVELRRGWSAYRLEVDLPRLAPGRERRLRCGGFHGVGEAWVNGASVGRFNADYLGFDLDVTEAAREGRNRIVIRVSNAYAPDLLPGIPDPDFHLYGGLGGGLHLADLPRVRLSRGECRVRWDPQAPGAIAVDLGWVNRTESAATAAARVAIRDPAGREVFAAESPAAPLAPGAAARPSVRGEVPDPRLWDPDSPALYTAEATLWQEGRLRDRLTWTFGLRAVRFDPKLGLVLNGRPFPLRGVNRHESLPGYGSALPPALHAADARRIRELGFNFVRLSHYPQSPAFLDACDRLGLLVYAEICTWKRLRAGGWLAAAEAQLERLIRRDRHHPSVLLWGLGNEGRDRRVYLRLRALARALDPERPACYAENHAHRARRRRTTGITEVWGLNYEFDALDFARAAAPTGCVIATECANLPYARRGHLPAEAQQVERIRAAVDRMEGAGPGAAGWALWCFADYATPRHQRWFRECGVVDGWRDGKLAADWVRARCRPEPFLSVRADWSLTAGPRRRVYTVTNCEELRFIRADGTGDVVLAPRPDLIERDVDFDGGPLRVIGRHERGTVEARLEPWGVPAAIRLRAAPVPEAAGAAHPLFRCEAQVVDARGAAVRVCEGEARVDAPAGVCASLIGGDRVPVRGGRAAFYLEWPADRAEGVLTFAMDGLPPQTLRWPLSAGSPAPEAEP